VTRDGKSQGEKYLMTGYRIQDTGYRIQDTRCRMQDKARGRIKFHPAYLKDTFFQ
jgi:hypothetical protein